jgi:hypothetical protein
MPLDQGLCLLICGYALLTRDHTDHLYRDTANQLQLCPQLNSAGANRLLMCTYTIVLSSK